ncbi:APC family permease [Limosilactobacillus fastidiosus]|uniref:Amino acid permease n=1 Tax=Limosilactobacillus fastidiosus TaxID=2759855 RepID=A0A7W3U031_9LACO|nr:amino acid permease [Limosilactobacillus fastidiosus]MBB1086185.1 amino acid permease [Limosilactobacillus fastidiosus]MCD7086485.1 amino acid permease [Limosilactobacillus fastidiosus]MCD7114645.1 amino acid permease [Limosilactobacillus fastidiosus]MCD7116506.1 amino acid permease [Limosilactobacillus fastidiosus]
MSFWKIITRKEDPRVYANKDGHLVRSLKVRDFLALGVGTIVSTSIFTLPGEVAAMHTGPSVAISFLLAAVVAGLVAFAYAEMSAAMPFAGSAYSWINVVFGEFFGWIAGWALLAEYFIALAFVGSGLSANFRALIAPLGLKLPASLSNAFGTDGGIVDLVSVLVIALVAALISRGVSRAARVENILVVLKVIAVLLFIVVGLTALHATNYVPFIPKYHETANGPFGGWQGIYAGVSMIFLSYIGFDSIAANSAEAVNPQKTMPRGILGSLSIAVILFVAVSLVLVGMLPYGKYANSAEPVGLALRAAGHAGVATVVQTIAVVGMFTALIGMSMAGSRLIYSFGRDGMLPKWLGKLDKSNRPNRALWTLTIVGILIGAFFPFAFLSQLISAGTLIAFMFVSIGIYPLRRREGKDINNPAFKVPLYPILPALGFIASFMVFMGLDYQAKIYAGGWFVLGLIIYFAYGMKHSYLNKK